ncbi:MAG: acetyl-CoA decarbonylase/synthase complex subunit delta [Deltaproteobacteria bacterium]|nr:acetyl-CoA decarbonylase/synthase complex subunit delta [Deltaproteobacteria bacterium]MBW2669586.1 acetyl-CoA decarbonylase/synthase complex subunit delta [Deltaproteobacteria bacterium]
MGLEIYKESYTGTIKEITLGKGDNAVTVGGQACYPFYNFEGDMPHKPVIAMEVWDMEPDEWPEAALSHFKDVLSDPAKWAKKCVDEFGAKIIVLQLKSTDPNGPDTSPEDAAATVKKVLDAVDVPLIVWGTGDIEKDEAVLKKISEETHGANLVIGPVEDKNHKGIGASAMGYGHTLISSSPIDINLAKQVNILLGNLGMPLDRLIVDPTTGGLGYGLEYTYSVMERLSMAALTQGDDKLQLPMINNIANEVWKCKEAKQTIDEAPTLGDPERRGILMEAVTAVIYLLSGGSVLIMRHPEAIRLTQAFIDFGLDGGSALDVAPISKQLDDVDIDYASLAPELDLTIEGEEPKKAPPKKKAAPKAEKKAEPAKKPAKKAAPKKEEKAVDKAEAEAKVKAEAVAKAKAETEAKAKAEADAKVKAEAEAKAKAEAETKAKAKAKAETEAKAKAEAEAKAEARAKKEAEEEAIREKRAKEREALSAKHKAVAGEVSMTPAAQQKSKLDKMLESLNRIHKRA